jgi:DNA polymerase I-like protein with 3'-5' exonuclease and polymerase domains
MLVDLQKRNELKLKYVNEIKKTQDWLDKITGRPLNVRSYPQIKRLCEEFLSLPKRSGYDEETLVAYMQNSIKKEEDEWKREVLKAVLRLRKLKLVKSNVLEARPDFDGRMRTQYNLNGTENGRTSTSKVDTKLTINRIVPTGLGFQTISKHGDIGSDVRYMFIPDPGHAFVNMDFSQAEPRIVAVLSEDWDLVDKFNKGIDVHSELASFISGKTQWDGKRAPDDVRFLGKTGRNAYNYNVGKRTFAQQVNTDADKFGIDVKISEWKAGEILKKVNMLHPKVVDVFHAQIKEHIDSTRTLVNPFGRRRQFFDRLEDSIYREGMAFIPQSTVRDQMLKLMIAFRKEFPELAKKICLEAHDALMIITPTDLIAPVAQFLLNWPKENPVDFSRCSLSRDFKLILPSEVEVSEKSYKDLRKYKPTA